MTLKLYNSLTRKIEPFEPLGEVVRVYTCGITPYDTTHLGHAFTYTSVDILIRFLQFKGYGVRYVQNVTDIDDDILRKAREVGEDWKALGDRWTRHFIDDMISLNVRPPNVFPRATEVIPDIIQFVQRLLEAGVAYEAGGNVYFSIQRWPEYGGLCCLPHEDMLPIANERGNIPDDPHKEDPLDFVLWQAQAPGEPAWDSPWGPGRPGWHIECSTMAQKFLGNTVDIHCGGADLLFPHHESEIAQVEAALRGTLFSRFWFHIAMVHHEGEKMSKSLGNLVMVRELLQIYPPDALRLYLASHHYRETWSHDDKHLAAMASLAERLREAATVGGGLGEPLEAQDVREAFVQALDEDLATGGAVEELAHLAERIRQAARQGKDVRGAQQTLRELAAVFGLRLDQAEPEPEVRRGWLQHRKRFEPATGVSPG